MNIIERFPSTKPLPLSRAVKAGGFIFLSGILPSDTNQGSIKGDIRAETRSVLKQIDETLRELDSGVERVVRVTVWLSDMTDFSGMNEEYANFFKSGLPARSTVQATLNRGAKVEMEVQALA